MYNEVDNNALYEKAEEEKSQCQDNEDQENRALIRTLKNWFQEDLAHVQKWRQEAREDFAFYNGDQWNEEDIALLKEQKRPIMTFNRIGPLVNAVLGSERNNKREVRYIPREMGDAIANEILTGAGEWFRDQSEAEYEESEAFSDAVICGMGWIDTRLDFENNPEGMPVVQRLDPLKMVWDSGAVKANLIDAERLWYVDEKPLHIAKQMFPHIAEHMLHADWAIHGMTEADENFNENGVTDEDFYQEGEDFSTHKRRMVTMVEARWFERETYYKLRDPISGEMQDYSVAQYKKLLEHYGALKGVALTRKIVKRAFLGKTLLAPIDTPLVPRNQLGWECISGYYDKLKQQFYGIVRPTKDPQRWSNKFFSQIMYLLNSQAKGGVLAERGAFDDDRQAEESFACADQITWIKNGALGRIQPKPSAQFPNGFFTLFQETKESITQVTGISSEFIGTREINQPGVLEMQRKKSSMNLLAQLFDSLTRYRKRQGGIILYLIQHYLADGRLISIAGADKQQYIPLTREAIADKQYDIIVDDAPTSANEKEHSFAVIQQILPLMKEYITPEIGMEILKYSPLPPSLVHKWMALHKEAEQKQMMPQQASFEQHIQQRKLEELERDAQNKQAQQKLALQKEALDLLQKQQKTHLDAQKFALEAEHRKILLQKELAKF